VTENSEGMTTEGSSTSKKWSQMLGSEDSSAREGSTEYRTQKIEFLVYVIQNFVTNNCL
jgi:hypothetical protein